MTVFELTHTIQNQMPVYPGTEPPQLTTACTIAQCGYQETLLHMYSHVGTHMDAPAHMIAGGATLDSYPPERFMGRAWVLDCRGQREIGLPLLLEQREQIERAEFLLFCTGWDRYWGSEDYYRGFPCLTEEAARYVAGLGLKGVGEDSISLDPCDTTDFPIHHILLGAGLVNTENLKGLDRLAGRECFFLTMPLKYENADGCCCRAAAVIAGTEADEG